MLLPNTLSKKVRTGCGKLSGSNIHKRRPQAKSKQTGAIAQSPNSNARHLWDGRCIARSLTRIFLPFRAGPVLLREVCANSGAAASSSSTNRVCFTCTRRPASCDSSMGGSILVVLSVALQLFFSRKHHTHTRTSARARQGYNYNSLRAPLALFPSSHSA